MCSEKFARVFCELKNRTIDTLVATSTESTSLPIMNGLTGGGAIGLGCLDPCVENELLWLLLPDGMGGSWNGSRALETLWRILLLGNIKDFFTRAYQCGRMEGLSFHLFCVLAGPRHMV